MFAIIKSGGKQYRVEKGHKIAVEKLIGEVGSAVEIKDVLLLGAGGENGGTVVGAPMVAEACVRAEIIRQDRLPKIRVFKKKRRKNYRRTHGHRQPVTWLRIDGIAVPEGMFPDLPEERPGKGAARTETEMAAEPAGMKMTSAEPEAERVVEEGVPATADKTAAAGDITPKEGPDDLTELPGIDEATAKNLNAVGVLRFRQVAAPDEKLAATLEEEPTLLEVLRRKEVIEKASALVRAREESKK